MIFLLIVLFMFLSLTINLYFMKENLKLYEELTYYKELEELKKKKVREND